MRLDSQNPLTVLLQSKRFLCALFFSLVLLFPAGTFAQCPLGIDVFDGDGVINWSNVQAAGFQFAWTKCTEGSDSTNTTYSYNMTNALAAGIYIGAYHRARYDEDLGVAGADAEAAFFWNNAKTYIKGGYGYLMPMLDIELPNTNGYTPATFSQWVNRWCQDIVNFGASNGMVLRPVIYTYTNIATTLFDNTVTNWPLWMVDPYTGRDPQTSAPTSITPWSSWDIWQYSWTNVVPGVPGTGGECDVDVFNGTLSQLLSSLAISVITNQPANLTVWQGSNATFSVGVPNSPGAVHYQWMFNGTNISGATKSSLAIANAQMTNAGAYCVYVTNSNGASDTSATAFLSVLPPLTNAAGSIVAPTNMVDWWPADGNCNDVFGPLNGSSQGGFYYVPGKSGEAFHFDGSTAFIITGSTEIPPPWTVCMWVNYSHTPQTSAALLEDSNYAIKLEQSGSPTHALGLSQGTNYIFSFNYSAPTNTWVHLAFVGHTNFIEVFANGVFKDSVKTNIPLPRAYIGAGYASNSARSVDFMFGSMDDLMIFNRALSGAEISSIYNAGAAGLIRAPQISGVQTTNGQLAIGLKGFTGKNFTIYSSTNLQTWTPLGTIANTNGTNTFIVSNVINQPPTFYRASQPY